MTNQPFRSGYVSLTGRPNVGKSTFLNTVLGEKVSIVSSKPQTTRNRIAGIKNLPGTQIVFVDTPGIHRPRHRLGELMVRRAQDALQDVDIVLFMVDPEEPGPGEWTIIDRFAGLTKPVLLLINKVDIARKPRLLPIIDAYARLYAFKEILPISALTGDGVDLVLLKLVELLPEGQPYYPDDILSDQVERFIVAEIIREKIIQETEEEVPHSVAVEVVDWRGREDGVIAIMATIYVERDGQKGIIIGKRGARLKEIGTLARADIESLLDAKVFLELWVKLKKDWRSSDRHLKELGYF